MDLPTVTAELAYSRTGDVSPDDDGRPRARTLDADAMNDPGTYDRRPCRIHDTAAAHGLRPDLRVHGFARADLARLAHLQATLARVRDAGRVLDGDAADIRRDLVGRRLPLTSGARLWLLYIARDGFILRRAGPGGARLTADAWAPGSNGHDAARSVHADQDVDGTPLRQLLRGVAPRLFHHDSPLHANASSPLFLVNVWIPLAQVTRPLALMDRRTLDRRAHQLRHGLPTDAFLRRRADMRINDIWTFLHAPEQRWWFTSDIGPTSAHIFDTLSTPHAAFVLPGEDRAAARRDQLLAAIAAVERRDLAAAARALAREADPRWQAPATAPLARAIAAMESTIATGQAHAPSLCRGEGAIGWCARARTTANAVIRTSLEMRAIALLTPA